MSYVHPELRTDLPVGKWLNDRPNIGIAMSGGGLRAAVCSLGWLRGLQHLNILSQARYMGANSGATWTILPLIARQLLTKQDSNVDVDYTALLGKYQEDLSDIQLQDRTELGEIGNVLEQSDIYDYERDPSTPASLTDWTNAIDENFVSPILSGTTKSNNKSGNKDSDHLKKDYWLDLNNVYLQNTLKSDDTTDEEYTTESTHTTTTTSGVLNQYHSLPFPIFVATGNVKDAPNRFFPIEQTFLYSGIPVDPRVLNPENTIGGGFLQGIGLNSVGPAMTNDDTFSDPVPVDDTKQYTKTMKVPHPPLGISQLAGASSNFAASLDAMSRVDLEKSHRLLDIANRLIGWFFNSDLRRSNLTGYFEPVRFQFWSPSTGGEKSTELELQDGGMFDNLGVLPLIRRGCSTIICCIAQGKDVEHIEQ